MTRLADQQKPLFRLIQSQCSWFSEGTFRVPGLDNSGPETVRGNQNLDQKETKASCGFADMYMRPHQISLRCTDAASHCPYCHNTLPQGGGGDPQCCSSSGKNKSFTVNWFFIWEHRRLIQTISVKIQDTDNKFTLINNYWLIVEIIIQCNPSLKANLVVFWIFLDAIYIINVSME